MDQDKAPGAQAVIGLEFTVISVAAWATHLFVCFEASEWGSLLAGKVACPVAVVHGVGIRIGLR